jgi:ABC-type uncharacterized transport system YnjBCD ATPase subunit
MDNINLGTNIAASVDGDILTIKIDLAARHGASGSGKSTIVATTGGNIAIPQCEVKLGLNAYVKR